MVELFEVGDRIVGAKLVAVGRKMSKVLVIAGTSSHKAQRIDVHGKPAKCFIDKPFYVKR